jgi:ABC-type spermidine/putrescine transport system permease subunit II
VNLAGTWAGVVALQTLFALSFAAVLFSELRSPRADRLEQLVYDLGGNSWAVWRHAVLPPASGLIRICFLQTALYSWLDYGLVSIVGGGHVASVTMKLFGYLREASVNQAAQASLVLLGPAWGGFFLAGWIGTFRQRRFEESVARS